MNVLVNGREVAVNDGATVRDLLDVLEIKGDAIAVEINRSVIPKAEHQTHVLSDGDRVEVVSFVGGG